MRSLGLGVDAGPEAIWAAYKERSRPLKRALLTATNADDKLRRRDALRELVVLRDMALGQSPPRDWRGEGLGISSREMIEELEHVVPARLDPIDARAFLEVSHGASEAEIREAFRLRARALTRRFAREEEDEAMERVRRAAGALRRVLHRALADPELPPPPPPAPRAGPRPEPSVEEREIRVERVPPDPQAGADGADEPRAVDAHAIDARPVDPQAGEVVLSEPPAPEEDAGGASPQERWADRPSDLPASGDTLGEGAAFGGHAQGSGAPIAGATTPREALRILGVGHDADRAEIVYAYKTQARGLRVAALLAEGETERGALIRDLRTLRRNRDLALQTLPRDG